MKNTNISLTLLAYRLKAKVTKVHSRLVDGKTRLCCYLDGELMTCVKAREVLIDRYNRLTK